MIWPLIAEFAATIDLAAADGPVLVHDGWLAVEVRDGDAVGDDERDPGGAT